MPAPQLEPRLHGLLSLSVELHLPAGWLRQQALAGRIPALRVGGRLLFNPAAVRRTLAVLAAESTATEGSELADRRPRRKK